VDLADYFGRQPVLLEFWATWCENCEALHPRMLEASDEYGDRVAFFAVAVAVGQSERRVRRHLADHPVPYPTLWDGRGEAVRAFETPATSYIVILDEDGRVAYTGIGRDQDVVRAVREVVDAASGG
jgi:thiol-disulfide isomerase/thioredoxin